EDVALAAQRHPFAVGSCGGAGLCRVEAGGKIELHVVGGEKRARVDRGHGARHLPGGAPRPPLRGDEARERRGAAGGGSEDGGGRADLHGALFLLRSASPAMSAITAHTRKTPAAASRSRPRSVSRQQMATMMLNTPMAVTRPWRSKRPSAMTAPDAMSQA